MVSYVCTHMSFRPMKIKCEVRAESTVNMSIHERDGVYSQGELELVKY